jgi:5'-nucleotidase
MKHRCYTLLLLSLITLTVVNAQTPLVLLHTNDVHSQLEPLPADDPRNPDKGGILRREAVCRIIRAQEPNVLVFESGDFVQGTPYFNFFKGEAEVRLLNAIKPTAVTLGNHEFDNGVDFLADMLKHADFPIVCTNYVVKGTPLARYVKPWMIVRKGGLRIGVISANIRPDGLIAQANFKGLKWLDPVKTAEKRAAWLKRVKKCDLVICLSHLGHKMDEGMVDDLALAAGSRHIDVILGAHTHTFLRQPVKINNLDGHPVIINQVGKSGIYVGRLDLLVEPD